MILYTIMPLELVMEGMGNQETSQERREIEIEVEGRKLVVQPQSATEGRVVRLLSTNPEDYLKGEWQPGSLIRFSPRPDNTND